MSLTESNDELVIQQTRCWIDNFIVKYNICPFARPVVEKNLINYRIINGYNTEHALEELIDECAILKQNDDIETSLLIYPEAFSEFNDYLDFLDLANELIRLQGYEGVYQLASFHPEYQFAETMKDDPANYTNRSPYPMLHLIREASIEEALKHYPQPEQIPERNIQFTRKQGLEKMQALLLQCLNGHQK